jgi:ferredoxin
LKILEQNSFNPQPPTSPAPPTVTLPIVNVAIDPARCTACGLCARFCPTGAIKFISDAEDFALIFQPGWCLGPACDICRLACPEQAIATQAAVNQTNWLAKKPLAGGDLAACVQCGTPVAKGPALPFTCFVCRPSRTADNLFTSLFK